MNSRYQWQHVLYAALIMAASGTTMAGGLRPANSSHGADVLFDVTCTIIWVDVGGNSEPFFPDGSGRIVVELPDSVEVITPATSGRDNFRCHGRLPFGEQVPAFDISAGEWIVATLADRDEACNALGYFFPDICRGANGPLVINIETTPFECFTVIDGVEFTTAHAHFITTKSGATNVSCHFDLDAADALQDAREQLAKRKQTHLRSPGAGG